MEVLILPFSKDEISRFICVNSYSEPLSSSIYLADRDLKAASALSKLNLNPFSSNLSG